jgi:hypothetical protein
MTIPPFSLACDSQPPRVPPSRSSRPSVGSASDRPANPRGQRQRHRGARIVAGACLGLLLTATVAPEASATLLLAEDFDSSNYVQGNTIHGTSPPVSNFTGSWNAPNDQFASFTTDNNRLEFLRPGSAGGQFPKFATRPIIANAVTQAPSTEFWAMGTLDLGNLDSVFFSQQLFSADGLSPALSRLVFGLHDSGQAFLATGHDGFTNSSTSIAFGNRTFSSLAQPLGPGEHTLLVQLLNQDSITQGNDFYRLWVNPDLSGGEAGLGAPDIELNDGNYIFNVGSSIVRNDGANNFRAAIVTNAVSGPHTGALDNYSIGTSFIAATGIPEPGRALLLAFSGTLLLWQRRRPSHRA